MASSSPPDLPVRKNPARHLVWHAVGALRTNRYSPGMITGMGLYVPLAVWGYPYFVLGGRASITTAIIAFFIGASYHLWVGRAIHLWRRRAA